MKQNRTHATVLFADICGYAAMMEHNEELAFWIVRRFIRQMKTTVLKCSGHILHFWGDGCLVTFDKATDAMDCSLQLQRIFLLKMHLGVRIGIHIGNIIRTETNAYGNVVNIASRVESLGVAGSVLFTKEVHHEIKNNKAFESTQVGTVRLKNITEIRCIYALRNEGLVIPASSVLEYSAAPDSSGQLLSTPLTLT